MNLSRCFVLMMLVSLFSTIAVAQKKVCIGSISGGDAAMWNLQEPLLKEITTQAKNMGSPLSTELMMSSNEKSARGEMSSMKCDFGLITSVSREWDQPKASSGLNAGGGGGQKDEPHPGSNARFHFTLLDNKGKRIDKFDTTIRMEMGYTAKDVQPELKDVIEQVGNWIIDGTAATK